MATTAAPAESEATMNEGDPVRSAVAAHWNRRAPTFDSDFGHSIVTEDERAEWVQQCVTLFLNGCRAQRVEG